MAPDSKTAPTELRNLLLESEANFNETFDQMAIGIAHVALDMRWRRVNQKLCDIVHLRLLDAESALAPRPARLG